MWTNHVSTSFKRTLCFQAHYSGKWPYDLPKAINDHLVKSLDNNLSDNIIGQAMYMYMYMSLYTYIQFHFHLWNSYFLAEPFTVYFHISWY